MGGCYFHDLYSMRHTYRCYRAFCLARGWRWMPYRRWLTEEGAACWLG